MADDDVQVRPLDLFDPAAHLDAARWTAIHAQVECEIFGPSGSAWTLAEIQAFHRSPDTVRKALGPGSGAPW